MQRYSIIILLVLVTSFLYAQENEWTPINNGLDNLQVYTVVDHPEDPDILYAGTEDGFYRSEDRGENWECPLGELPVRSIWVSPDGRTILIARSGGSWSDGIWISRDGGDNFDVLHWFIWPSAIAVDPDNDDLIFCGTLEDGFIYTLDGGGNWQQANDGLRDGAIYYLGVKNLEDETYLFASSENGLFRCVIDDDIEWEDIGLSCTGQMAFSFEDERGVFAGTGDESESDGLYYSDNLGDDWDWPPLIWGHYVQAVETMPNLVVMASTEIGVMRSIDGGENWTEMNEELDDFDISDLLVQVDDDETRFYCTTNGSGIFVYTIPVQEDHPPSLFSLLEPENGDTLDSRLITFRWEESEDPDPEDEITYDWWIGRDGESLFLNDLDATELTVRLDTLDIDTPAGEMITWWVVALSGDLQTECNDRFTFSIEQESVREDNIVSAGGFYLHPLYPNPFNASTTIRYGLPFPTDISLTVYNSLGRRMATLFEGYRQSGIHNATLTVTYLPSGLYFVRLETADITQTQKVMLIR